MADMHEELVRSTEVYKGRLLRLTKDEVRLENGEMGVREIVHHGGGACALALTEDGRVYVVRQYRHAVGRVMLELPAGKLEPGEDPLVAARRELAEEAGVEAEHWRSLGVFYPTVGYCTERIYLYLATGLTPTQTHLDDDEFLQAETMPLQQLVDKCLADEIEDGKTVAACLKVAALAAAGRL